MLAKTLLCAVVAGAAFTYVGCSAPINNEASDGTTSSDLGNGKVDTVSAAEVAEAKADLGNYQDIPDMTADQRQAILDRYSSIQHAGVRDALYQQAILYYDTNLAVIPNKNYLTVVDFQKPSGQKRFFIMDMNGGPMTSHMVAHGLNSDPNNTGMATSFSNTDGSYQSSLGFYQASETYDGVHGESVHLDGLSSTNSNVRERVIVIHSADYVDDSNAKQGRSEGCFALSVADKPAVVAQLNGGSVIYASN